MGEILAFKVSFLTPPNMEILMVFFISMRIKFFATFLAWTTMIEGRLNVTYRDSWKADNITLD